MRDLGLGDACVLAVRPRVAAAAERIHAKWEIPGDPGGVGCAVSGSGCSKRSPRARTSTHTAHIIEIGCLGYKEHGVGQIRALCASRWLLLT